MTTWAEWEPMTDDQAWFESPEWQERERAADESFAAGRFARFYNGKDFLAELPRNEVAGNPMTETTYTERLRDAAREVLDHLEGTTPWPRAPWACFAELRAALDATTRGTMTTYTVRVNHEAGQLWATVDEQPGLFATGDDLAELFATLGGVLAAGSESSWVTERRDAQDLSAEDLVAKLRSGRPAELARPTTGSDAECYWWSATR